MLNVHFNEKHCNMNLIWETAVCAHIHTRTLQMIQRSGLVGCVIEHWAGISVRIISSV